MQISDAAEQGQKVTTFYKLTPDMLPITFVVDPVTGQKLVEWQKFVAAEKLVRLLWAPPLRNQPVSVPVLPLFE